MNMVYKALARFILFIAIIGTSVYIGGYVLAVSVKNWFKHGIAGDIVQTVNIAKMWFKAMWQTMITLNRTPIDSFVNYVDSEYGKGT